MTNSAGRPGPDRRMKGIVLAGGTGSRLHPTTLAVSKQMLPVGDKPLIYYPISVLMLAGIRDILVISSPADLPQFRRLLGDGSRLGILIDYAVQDAPNGLAEALTIGADHIGDGPVALVLGDNVFHGPRFDEILADSTLLIGGEAGCVLFGYPVDDPERYAVGATDARGRLVSLEEKPCRPRSNRAITGLYLYDNQVVEVAKNVAPSDRGELEITDVNRWYLQRDRARLVDLGRGFAWLDAGTPESLFQAGQYVKAVEEHQGVRIACLEEVALRKGFITPDDCYDLGRRMDGSPYGRYVMDIARELAT